MAKVTPNVLLNGLPWASCKVPANLIRRGTANVGTSSLGACTVRLGAWGSAATGRCCACAAGTPKHKTNTKPTPVHLTVRFMAPLLSSQAEGFIIFSCVRATPRGFHERRRFKEAGRCPTSLGATVTLHVRGWQRNLMPTHSAPLPAQPLP